MQTSEVERLLKAASFAAEKHRNCRRKNAEASPYINHPLEVAYVLSSAGGVTDVEVLAAALLHDTVEDTGTTPEDLEREFGSRIAATVAEVTDDKSLKKKKRKRLQVKTAGSKSDAAKLVKLADKICNLQDMATAPPDRWSIKRRKAYFKWSRKVVAGLRGVNRALETTFDQTHDAGVKALAALQVKLPSKGRTRGGGDERS